MVIVADAVSHNNRVSGINAGMSRTTSSAATAMPLATVIGTARVSRRAIPDAEMRPRIGTRAVQVLRRVIPDAEIPRQIAINPARGSHPEIPEAETWPQTATRTDQTLHPAVTDSNARHRDALVAKTTNAFVLRRTATVLRRFSAAETIWPIPTGPERRDSNLVRPTIDQDRAVSHRRDLRRKGRHRAARPRHARPRHELHPTVLHGRRSEAHRAADVARRARQGAPAAANAEIRGKDYVNLRS